ncbi:MAG: peptide chain release factor N(5)-glutamine methyltransferase [Chromatiales bacterium]|nr:peptide chain release factor N(5)-glutamine methyltransferase [Chromatiales bacterium]MBT6441835.1 peptide chain release factor N(5)-glutamine methyltransferase [Alphaproteobacteria bacterium]
MSAPAHDQSTVGGALAAAASRLRGASVESPRLDARLLLRHAAGLRDEEILAKRDEVLPAALIRRFETLVVRREAHEPIAYIVGEKDFWSLPFEVSPATLIPRPDSETVVAAALRHLPAPPPGLRILDLGVGSGCLLISILHEIASATGLGVDNNSDAVVIARRNAVRADVGARAQFIVGDWTQAIFGQFDIIVTNPPYVGENERATMATDVVAYEPATALFAGAQGDDAYTALALQLAPQLASGGVVIAEFGRDQASRVGQIFLTGGLVELERCTDLAGIERCAVYGHAGSTPKRR